MTGQEAHTAERGGEAASLERGWRVFVPGSRQRTKLVLRLEETIKERAKANREEHQGRPNKLEQNSAAVNHIETREEIAKLAGVSRDSQEHLARVRVERPQAGNR